MIRSVAVLTTIMACVTSWADDLSQADRLLCSTNQVQMCFETGECFPALPWQIDMPQFVIIDTGRRLISTTPGSGEQRSTPIASILREGGHLIIQGFEQGRAFSIVIEEDIGAFSAAIARDGIAVSAFGACTDLRKL